MEPHHYRHGTSLLDARCLTIFGTGHHQRRHAGSPKQALSLTIQPAPFITITGTQHHYSGSVRTTDTGPKRTRAALTGRSRRKMRPETGTERHYSRAGCGPGAARGLTISAGGGAGRPEAPAAKLTNGGLCHLRTPPTLGRTILVSGPQAFTTPPQGKISE